MRNSSADARDLRDYVVGFVAAVGLTLAAFGLVIARPLSAGYTSLAICLLGLIQIAVHFRFFLHIDFARSHRDDLQLVLFTSLIILLMVGGSLWVLTDLHMRMQIPRG
jgi:cytochrome o ubiquinol oxidase operon protein cyoD